LCQVSGCSMVSAYLEPDVAAGVFGDPRAILAWGPGPDGRAVAVDGGYRVSGTWSFASGSRHATWLGAHCAIHEAGGAVRDPAGRIMLFPAARATMLDVWNVIGLRGTGSDSYTVTDLFVPRAFTVARDAEAERRHPGAVYCFTTNSIYASGFAGLALGVARRMLEAFVALARDKTPRGHRQALRDSATVQSQTARAEVRLAAARTFLLATLEDVWRAVGRARAMSLAQRVRIRLAATHAVHEATAVADFTYHAAGATAIFLGSAFERRFRDIHTVSQQIQGRTSHYETVGRFMFGLEPDTLFM
ncbi:MAG TPA: acyl-CoA dehydrogenase, partial [Methylomirabilota bacterium]|nr:acyl-CoA dehydrogenase [Methylomirabilota bacterium]